MIVLGGTFRGISYDDFDDAIHGRESGDKDGGRMMDDDGKKYGGKAGKGDEVSLPAFMQMVKGMGGRKK